MEAQNKVKDAEKRALEALESLVLATDNSNHAHTISIHSIAQGEIQARVRTDNMRSTEYSQVDMDMLFNQELFITGLAANWQEKSNFAALI